MATSKKRKQQAERLSVIRGLQGDRLNECLKKRSMRPADLAHNYYNEFHVEIPSSHLTMIRKGQRSLPYDYAVAFSDYLDIDSGYLLGADNFRFDSYDEYVEGIADLWVKSRGEKMDKQLTFAFRYIAEETERLMNTAIEEERLTRKEWDKVNKLLEVFSEDIKNVVGVPGIHIEWKEK